MPLDSLTIATRPGQHPLVTAGCHAQDQPSLRVVKDSLIYSICLSLQVYQWLEQVVTMPSDSLTIATLPGPHPLVTAGCHAWDQPSLRVVKDSLIYSICLSLQVYQWLEQVVTMPSDSLTIATLPGPHPLVTAGCHAQDPPSL